MSMTLEEIRNLKEGDAVIWDGPTQMMVYGTVVQRAYTMTIIEWEDGKVGGFYEGDKAWKFIYKV